MKKLLLNLGLMLGALLAALLLAELMVRLVAPQRIVPRYVTASDYGVRRHLPYVRGRMITPEYSIELRTNSAGMRGAAEYVRPKPGEVYRVLVLGDSVAFGHGVEEDETFAAVLEKELSKKRPTEVVNLGVAGIGTAEELLHLKHWGLSYQPDLVILAYFPNDPVNNLVSGLFQIKGGKLTRAAAGYDPAMRIRDGLSKVPGYTWLIQNSHLANLLRNLVSGLIQRRMHHDRKFQSTIPRQLDPQAAQLTAALVNAIAQMTSQRKIPLIVLDVPVRRGDNLYSNLPRDQLTSSPLVKVVEVKSQVFGARPVAQLYYQSDRHPRPLGQRLMGEYLAGFIEERIWPQEAKHD